MSRITHQHFLGRKIVRFSGKPQRCTKIIKMPYETFALLATGKIAYSSDHFFKFAMTTQREYSYVRLADAMLALGVLSKAEHAAFVAKATRYEEARERARDVEELRRLTKLHGFVFSPRKSRKR